MKGKIMKQLTDEDIVKAMHIHKDLIDCSNCVYIADKECSRVMLQNAINLINRQKAEIKRLKEKNISNEYPNCVLVSKGIICTKTLEDYDKLISDISAEAIKEFVDRLCDGKVLNDKTVIEAKVLLKEMVGEE